MALGTAKLASVLFADDTICISENAKAISRLLKEIQREGRKYGLILNKNKCEVIRIYRGGVFQEEDKITFEDGTEVKVSEEATYLGCWLNSRGDPNKEINQRISNCMTILKN